MKLRQLLTNAINGLFKNDYNANMQDIENNFNSIQTQVNNLVVNGDSSPAVAQALVDVYGEESDTLKARLDAEQLLNVLRTTSEKMVSKAIKKMMDGLAVEIVCFGDSMTFGWEPGTGNQVAEPYPLRLQTILRTAFNNQHITVVNTGVGGWTSGTGLANLNTKVLTYNPDLAIVMFGINDARQLVPIDTFRANMLEMVRQMKDSGIEVTLLSSTPIMDTTDNHHSLLLDYVKATQEVADTFKVAFIDMYKEVYNLFFNGFENKFSLLADGIHFKNEKYRVMAEIVAGKLIHAQNATSIFKLQNNAEMRIPLVKSAFVQTDCTLTSSNDLPFFSQNYILRQDGANGTYLKFHFYNDIPNMSLVVSGPKNGNGGKISVKLNGAEAVVLDCYANDSTVYEAETVIVENLAAGFHTLEFLSSAITTGQTLETVSLIYLTELIFRPQRTKQPTLYTLNSSASLPVVEVFEKVTEGKVRFTNNNVPGATGILFFDERTELKPGKTLIIEVESKFMSGCGITWFGNVANNGDGSRFCKANSGYLVSLSSSQVDLYNFGANNAFGTAIATWSGTTTFTANKVLRIEHTYAGLISVYLDGVKLLETTNTKACSGRFGIYAYNGGTFEVDRYEYTYK